MGLLDKLRDLAGSPVPSGPPPTKAGHLILSQSTPGRVVTGQQTDWSRFDDHTRLKVVGESHYQEALIRVSKCPPKGSHAYECVAVLVPEPTNEYDKNAVMVQVDGEHVGYLPRGSARLYSKRLRAMAASGKPCICWAYIGRSEDLGHANLGVSLRVPNNSEIMKPNGSF